MARPTGTVTFLFTDIEGSTRRWESDPEGMRGALAVHDDLLRSAIENVMRNAVKYTRTDSEVEVTLEHIGSPGHESAVIRVRDHGDGVPEDALENIFRPFYRVADSRERSSGGAGLGLSIAAKAVSLHGGQVKAENSPAGGLMVELRFPLNRKSSDVRVGFLQASLRNADA